MVEVSQRILPSTASRRPDAAARDQHANAFGFLRLLFASLVILSHAAELHDGDRHRELLMRLSGTISFADLAVDGFFLVSGYLIAASYCGSTSGIAYLYRRIARIYPAFLVCFLICLLIVVPLGGGALPSQPWQFLVLGVRALLLQSPDMSTVFAGQPYSAANGAMWTIGYEFRCYLVVMMLGAFGLLRRRSVMFVATSLLLLFAALSPEIYRSYDPTAGSNLPDMVIGSATHNFRLFSLFLTGSCFYLFRDRIAFRTSAVLAAAAALILSLGVDRLAHPGVAVFGGYLIFTFATTQRDTVFARINNANDVSYGVYLYAWPITKLLYWWWPDLPLPVVGVATFGLAYGAGWLSWVAVERPVLRRIRRKRAPFGDTVAAAASTDWGTATSVAL